jgi:hypothetical protein
MTHLFSKTALACAVVLLALAGQANAGSPLTLPGTSIVVPVGDARAFDRPDVGAYGPNVWHEDGRDERYDGSDVNLHEPQSAGADEIRELQRMFPQTNWPSSMRY